MLKGIMLVIICYFIGSIPFSYIFPRIFTDVDVRSRGSGNVGATNVLRTVGIKVALLAFAGDLLKGALAAWIGVSTENGWLLIICCMAAVIGHCYPVFLNFKGGKAVASAGGIVLFLMPKIGLTLLLLFACIVFVSRYVSLGSVTIAAFLPITAMLAGQQPDYVILCWLLAALVIYRHRENIVRLRNGTESRLRDPV
ncbi:MAG: glycerol-3-phosphate 1-O-acyltransferase PlsY [Deltaproteobacteria bacterium]